MDFNQILAITQLTYKNIEARLLSDVNAFEGTKYRKSGCYALDYLLANHNEGGGLPRGRILEYFGPENSGKTTLATICCASVNKYKSRNKALFIDFEHKWDMNYGLLLGIQPDKFLFSQPSGADSGIGGLQLFINAIDADDLGIIVVDSLPAVMPKEEEEGELTDANIGAQARLWAKALRKASLKNTPNSPTIIITNQLRDNIGASWGPKEKTAGGRALKFTATCRVDIRGREKEDGEDDNVISQEVELKIIKNQSGENFQHTKTTITFGEGFENEKWVIEKADSLGILNKKSKKFFYFNEDKTLSGELEGYINYVKETPGELDRLYKLCVRKRHNRDLSEPSLKEPDSKVVEVPDLEVISL